MAALVKSVAAFGVAVLLSGCVIYPYPHVARVSPDVEGKLVDSVSGAPVVGASVCFVNRPGVATVSGADGCFTLPCARDFYVLHWSTYDGIDTDIPYKEPPVGKLRISHPDYFALEFAIPEAATNNYWCERRHLEVRERIGLDPVVK
jgi:hypothetical protein